MEIEAKKWLMDNNLPCPLASNYFENRDDAVRYIDSLYTLGADMVLINTKNITQEEGRPYADSLVVKFNEQSKEQLMHFIESTKQRAWCVTEYSIENNTATLYWD